MKETILVVEDDEKLRNTVMDFLKLYEYNTVPAADGREALKYFDENFQNIDLVLLDIMLPIYDGQYVLKKIRENSNVPVIMITAKAGDYEQLKSFGNGVDDYIKKPFVLSVLKARIEAVLKRFDGVKKDDYSAGKIRIEGKSRKVYVDDNLLQTTPKEFDLLNYLIKNEGVVLSRDQILDNVWGSEYDGTFRTVDTLIKQLRIKLGKKCQYIRSVYGVGYIFEVKDV